MGLLDPITGASMVPGQNTGAPSGDGGSLPVSDYSIDSNYNPGYAVPDNSVSGSDSGSLLYGGSGNDIAPSAPPQVAANPGPSYNIQQSQVPHPATNPKIPDDIVWGIQARDSYIRQLEGWAEQFRPLEIALQQNPHLQDVILRELSGQRNIQQDASAPPPAPDQRQVPPPAAMPQMPTQAQMAGLPPAVAAKMQNDMHNMQVTMHELQATQKLKDMQQMYGSSFNPNELLNYSLATGILDLDEAYIRMVGQRSLQYWQQHQQAMRNQSYAPQGQVNVDPQSMQHRSNVPAAPRVQPPSARASAPAVPVARPRDWAEATEQAIRMLGAR